MKMVVKAHQRATYATEFEVDLGPLVTDGKTARSLVRKALATGALNEGWDEAIDRMPVGPEWSGLVIDEIVDPDEDVAEVLSESPPDPVSRATGSATQAPTNPEESVRQRRAAAAGRIGYGG